MGLVLNNVGRSLSIESILGVKDVSLLPSSWIVTFTVNVVKFPSMLKSICGKLEFHVTLEERPLETNVGSLIS